MASENIVKNRYYRVLTDAENEVWDTVSFNNFAEDTNFDDGQNAEVKLGAVNGITSDLACEDESIAASAAALNQVNRNLGDCKFSVESDGAYVTYTVGADTVTKKLGSGELTLLHNEFYQPSSGTIGVNSITWEHTVTESCKLLVHAMSIYDGNGGTGSNTIVATKNGIDIEPTITMQAQYYSQPLTCIYEFEAEVGDLLIFTPSAKIIDETSNPSAERCYLAITAYST